MNLVLAWKKTPNGNDMLFLGSIRVITITKPWQEINYRINMLLPGIKIKDDVRFTTIDIAKKAAEMVVRRWVEKAELRSVYDVVIDEQRPDVQDITFCG